MAYLIGLDLGQAQDYSALVLVEQRPSPPAVATYAVRLLHRWEFGTPYPAIVQAVHSLLHRSPVAGHATLLVDYTGVGRPIVDSLRQNGLTLQAVALHGGDAVSHVGLNWRVPKRDLVGAVQMLLQQRRLQCAHALPLTDTLTRELLDFKVRIDPATAHDSYSAWYENDHNDLVLALALAVWWGEREAQARVPTLDMSRALRGLTKCSGWRTPGSSPRFFRGDYDEDLYE